MFQAGIYCEKLQLLVFYIHQVITNTVIKRSFIKNHICFHIIPKDAYSFLPYYDNFLLEIVISALKENWKCILSMASCQNYHFLCAASFNPLRIS